MVYYMSLFTYTNTDTGYIYRMYSNDMRSRHLDRQTDKHVHFTFIRET